MTRIMLAMLLFLASLSGLDSAPMVPGSGGDLTPAAGGASGTIPPPPGCTAALKFDGACNAILFFMRLE